MTYQFATASRIFRRRDDAARLITRLMEADVWFEVQPEPYERTRITVKREASGMLPPFMDWQESATDGELVEHARTVWPEEFDGEGTRLRDPKVVERYDAGYVVTAEVWVDYPQLTI